MRFRLLGGLAVEDPEKTAALGGPKQRAVLAALLIEPRQPLSAAALADRIWGDDLPVRYQTSIQAYVSNLRRHLEPDRSSRTPATVLVSRAAGYAMDVDDAEIDASHFRSLVERVHQLRRAGHAAEEVLGVIDQAMACWSGPLLPELAGRAWVDVPATALLEQRRQILVAKTELLVETGAPGEALVAAEMALTDSAYDEHLHGLVAICRYQMGNQRQALAGLQDVRRLLADEIGVNPGPEFQQVEHDILAHHPRLSPPEHRSGSTPPVVAPPLPADSAPTNSATLAVRPFVGRTDELARLRSARTKAHAGIGHFIIVRGEAGIGKSRLIDQFVHEDNNDTVAWGRCPETSAQASYWVCSQIVRQLEGAEVIDAVPLLTLAAQSINAGFDAFDSRWSFYRATVDALAKVKRPVTVVVDDLQYADPASLRLIGFLAGEITTMPVLVVVIVRPITAHDSIELIDCLAEIGRLPDTERIDLGGLTVDDIGALLAEMIGHRPNTGIVESVADRTGGNAFFVSELARMLSRGEAGRVVPGAVSDVVRSRSARLPQETRDLLDLACVIGREFRIDVLADVRGSSSAAVIDALAPAIAAGLLEESEQPSTLRFAHGIVADALLANVGGAQQARVHAAAAHSLVARGAGVVEEHVALIAHHAYAGIAAGAASLAYEWTARCARLATARLADEDAAVLWGRAAEAASVADPVDCRPRLDALVEQGRVYLRLDDVIGAINCLVPAIELALETGDDARLENAVNALDVPGFWRAGEIGGLKVDIADVLERAIVRLPSPSPVRAVALGSLADFGYRNRSVAQTDAASAEAVAVARATKSLDVLTHALHRRAQATWRPKDMSARREAVAELGRLAEDDRVAGVLRSYAFFDSAVIAWVDGGVDEADRLLGQARVVTPSSATFETQFQFFESAIALWRGRLDQAAELADAAHSIYRNTRGWAAEEFHAAFLSSTLLEQDRLSDAIAAAEVLTTGPYARMFSELAVFIMLEAGQYQLAAQTVRPLPPDFDTWMFPAVMSLAATNRAVLGDIPAALEAARRLVPLSGQLAAPGPAVAIGTVDQARARALWCAGDTAGATEAIDRAIDVLTRAGAGPWLVRGLMLRFEISRRADDRDQAIELADRLNLPFLRRRLNTLP